MGTAPDAVGRASVEDAKRLQSRYEGVPMWDPAFSILSATLDIVPVSSWTFARVDTKGELETLYSSSSCDNGTADLAGELSQQRSKSSSGPRIATTLGSLGEFANGITLVFADARAYFGILTMLRTAELGPFTSTEMRMLRFALDALSERLSTLRMQSPGHSPTMPAPEIGLNADASESAFYVLDSDLKIVLAWTSDEQRRAMLTGLHPQMADRLPVILEQSVRELTVAWTSESVKMPGVARPVPFLVVRTQPMSGPAGFFIGVRIDRFQPPNSLTGPVSRYHISPREVQVLALLFDGNHLDQIAIHLHITSSTVQDHIKSMLDKTESRNRSELIARILGWESTSSASQA